MKLNNNHKKLAIVIFINLLIFIICNSICNIKYEEVDDFIIYNLYSGLDGTYNVHGVYIHPLICLIISIFYRIIPVVNWHTIFLLIMQFICFTLIGYSILKKHDSTISIVLYAVFASAFYTSLLMLIQYTSVAALLIATSLVICVDIIEQNKKTKCIILMFILYTIGIMTRMQSLLIVAPFMGIYLLIKMIDYKNKNIDKEQVFRLLKYYLVYLIITVLVYVSSMIIYNSNDVYKEYTKYNEVRTYLHDILQVDYKENKEIFDEIGWSENDWYLFYTFNMGDENIYSYENLQKILEYKIEKDGIKYFDTSLPEATTSFLSEVMNTYLLLFIIFFMSFIISILTTDQKKLINVLIFLATIAVHILFIILKRSIHRVVIPEYIIGTALLIYNIDIKNNQYKIKDIVKSLDVSIIIIGFLCILMINQYYYKYDLEVYSNYQELINYTNDNKDNVYLYTVPSLQSRYLAYSVYKMPPEGSFSNLRVMGRMGYVYTKLL